MLINFTKLPKIYIIAFLKKININENLNLSNKEIEKIQEHFDNDIRSMINYMQSINNDKFIIDKIKICNLNKYVLVNNIKNFQLYINKLSLKYNISIIDIIKIYIINIINNCLISKITIDNKFVENLQLIIHNYSNNISNEQNSLFIKYFFYSLFEFKNLLDDK